MNLVFFVGPDTISIGRSNTHSVVEDDRHRELFLFGVGEWRDDREATEVMKDPGGRWFIFAVQASTMLREKKPRPTEVAKLL